MEWQGGDAAIYISNDPYPIVQVNPDAVIDDLVPVMVSIVNELMRGTYVEALHKLSIHNTLLRAQLGDQPEPGMIIFGEDE